MIYECTKCGGECLVEFEDHRPDSWCEECNDYPGGWYEAYEDILVDYISARADWIHDKMKD